MIRASRIALVATLVVVPCLAHAADAPAPAPAPVAVASVPVALAAEAAQAAVESCRAQGYKVAVAVVDADGAVRVLVRGEGAAEPPVDLSRRKAYTAAKMRMSSGDFGKTVAGAAPPPGAGAPAGSPPAPPPPGKFMPPPGVNGDDNLITWGGGLPIRAGDQLLGAIGVSGAPGGALDEACGNVGLARIAGRLK